MLYLKNSLVNLTIIFYSLFFFTAVSTDDNNFIFPKKKIITIKTDEKKQNNTEISKNFTSIVLPQKNPLRGNSIEQKRQKDSKEISKLTEKKKTQTIPLLVYLKKNLSHKLILKFKMKLSLF